MLHFVLLWFLGAADERGRRAWEVAFSETED
jgi:hypothetical protein